MLLRIEPYALISLRSILDMTSSLITLFYQRGKGICLVSGRIRSLVLTTYTLGQKLGHWKELQDSLFVTGRGEARTESPDACRVHANVHPLCVFVYSDRG